MLRFRQYLTEASEEQIISSFKTSAKIELKDLIGGVDLGDYLKDNIFTTAFSGEKGLKKYQTNKVDVVWISNGKISPRSKTESVMPKFDPGQGQNWFDILKGNPFTDGKYVEWKKNPTEKAGNSRTKGIIFLLWYIAIGNETKIISYQASKSGSSKVAGKLSNATDIFEQVAAASFKLGKTTLPVENEDLIELLKKEIGSATDAGGIEFTDDNWNYYTNETGQVRMAAQGVQNFLSQHPEPVGKKKIIWSTIRPVYYKFMRTNSNYAITDKKENTADLAILYGNLDVNTVFGEEYSISNETSDGYLEVFKDGKSIGSILQVSLKIEKEGAQVGKSGKDYQPYTTVIDPEDSSKRKSRKNITLRQLKKTLQINQNNPVEEGFFGDIIRSAGTFVRKSIDTLKKYLNIALNKLSRFHQSLVNKLSSRNVMKQYSKELKTFVRKLGIREEHLTEAMKDEDIVDAIMEHRNGPTEVVVATNKALESLRKTLKKITDKGDFLKVRIIDDLNVNNFDKLEKDDIRYLLCNKIAFETLESFYNDVMASEIKDPEGNAIEDIFTAIAQYTVDMGITTLMGESLLPVVKLYGAEKIGEKNWELLSRNDMKYIDAVNQAKTKLIEVGGIDIGKSQQSASWRETKIDGLGYYTVQQITLAKYEDGKPVYNKIQLRTGGRAGGFSYFVEANKQVNKVEF